MIEIRHIAHEDATALCALRSQIDAETKFMMLEPGERATTAEQQHAEIVKILATDNRMIFLAVADEKPVGFLSAIGGAFRRNHHNIHIVVGVLDAYTNRGIGTQLFFACEQWARQQSLHRLELTVMTHNDLGIALYKKMGFVIEGTSKDMLCVDGQFVDLHYMYKLLT
jgi:RimJ/RimL family protein N-acetyltransferase